MTLRPGTVVSISAPGRARVVSFRVLEEVAAGAFGSVHLAQDAERGAFGLLKVARAGAAAERGLEIELRILEQLAHPALVRCLGSGRGPGGELVVAEERLFPNPMLALSDRGLRASLPRDPGTTHYPLPPSLALQLGVDLFQGIEYLHGVGFVHHDVKPENHLVRLLGRRAVVGKREGLLEVVRGQARGVLIDTGGSRSFAYLSDLSGGRVQSGFVAPAVTPLYAPPEVWGGEFLPSMDVYAAGLTLYAYATGRRPYDHLAERVVDLKQLVELKRRERTGQELPLSRAALEGRALGPLADPLFELLRRCVGDPTQRPTARAARREVEQLAGRIVPTRGRRAASGVQLGVSLRRETPQPVAFRD